MMPDPLVADVARLAFLDRQSIPLAVPLSAIEACNLIKSQPVPGLGMAMRLRDAISSRFGVRRIGGFSSKQAELPQVGDRLDFFLVEQSLPDLLVLTERDRHLDVMTCISTANGCLAITTSVVTHNLFGRLYMIPVAPAHRMIVAWMLRRVAGRLRA